jgi:TatD DNase family protein
MTVSLIDSHAHMDMDEFAPDRDAVITRAGQAGVAKIVTVGIDIESSRKAIALAEKYPQIYAAIGIHPHEADKVTFADISRLRELAKHEKVVAIGETGLDFYRKYSEKDAQVRLLSWQLGLAADCNLPVIIHARQAANDAIVILTEWVKQRRTASYRPRGVIHCFSEDATVAKQYLNLGFYISFAGYVSYPKSRAAQIVKSIPIDKIMVETDSPFLPPQKSRGQRNEPAYVAITAEILATSLGMTPEEFGRRTTENSTLLFKL